MQYKMHSFQPEEYDRQAKLLMIGSSGAFSFLPPTRAAPSSHPPTPPPLRRARGVCFPVRARMHFLCAYIPVCVSVSGIGGC